MQKLSIFVFCLFVSAAGVNAQEKTTSTAGQPATVKKTTVKKTVTTTKSKKTTKVHSLIAGNVPPPPPAANGQAPIPVPLPEGAVPLPIDPHAPPPPPRAMPQGGPMTPKERMALRNAPGKGPKAPLPPGGPNDGHDHLPPTPPGPNAPPRPYDPAVDNVPVGPNAGEFKFVEETHSFGTFEEGPIVETDFEFTNIGKEPITIKESHASCGCTVPTWPKEPIAPGKKGKIHVTFNSKGRVGQIHKDVTIVSNAKQQPMMVHIAGEVKEAKKN